MSDMKPEDALFASAGLLVAKDQKIAEQQKRIEELERERDEARAEAKASAGPDWIFPWENQE